MSAPDSIAMTDEETGSITFDDTPPFDAGKRIVEALEANAVSLRDRFAMAALTGAIARGNAAIGIEEKASLAYRYADAMLAAEIQSRRLALCPDPEDA